MTLNQALNPLTGDFNLVNNITGPASIPGLNTVLQNKKGYQIVCGSRTDLGTLTGGIASSTGIQTTRLSYIPAASSDSVILVFGNYSGGNAFGEAPGNNFIKLQASLESAGGYRAPVTFNGGSLWIEVPCFGLVYSDPIPFNMVKGTQFWVRTGIQVPGSGYLIPQGSALQGGSGAGGVNNGDGASTSGNFVLGSSVIGANTGNGAGPVAILGQVPTPLATAGAIGDSICQGLEDGGYAQNAGGWLRRGLEGQLGLNYAFPVTPSVPYVLCSKPGETLAQFVNAIQTSPGTGHQIRAQIANLASTIISEYGTNDIAIGTTLATMQTLQLTLANFFLGLGKYFVGCTILPRVTSTDGYVTTANQTPIASESVRNAYNTWLRDPSANGFVQQTAVPAKAAIFDAAAAIEVNASNVLTLNGSFWMIAPNGGTPIVSGTLTAATQTAVSDTTKTWTTDQWRGYVVRMINGNGINTNQSIYRTIAASSQLGVISYGAGNIPSIGDSYIIFQTYTSEGTHPTSIGYQLIAQSFPLSLVR